jgi:PPIC-type PPIASE domain
MKIRTSRVGWIGAMLVLASLVGCSRGPSANALRNETVASAAGQQLSGGTLERWLLQLPSAPTHPAAVTLVSNWVDETLVADAMQRGAPLDDSATVDAAITPDAARGMSLKYWQARAAVRPAITDQQADSLVTLDQLRVFQHLVLRLPPNPDTATMQSVAARAAALQARAKNGEDFSSLVRQYSEDTLGRRTGGYMGAMRKSSLPRQIAGAIWALHPGEVSSLLHTPAGVEVLRRVTAAEARPALKQWLGPELARRADSVFVDSLSRAKHLTVPETSLPRVRRIAQEPVVADSGGPLATWDGGSLTPDAVRMWLMMVPPANRDQLTVASDSAARAFLHGLAERQMVVALAAPEGPVTPEARKALVPQYNTELSAVETDLRHAGASGTFAPGVVASAYVDSVLAGKVRFHLLPGELAGVLRSRQPVSVDDAAIRAVLTLAATGWSVKHANDTIPGRR